MKPRIISGIQPSGKLHIGNYLGALKKFLKLQEYKFQQCLFMVADYHSITEDYDLKEKEKQVLELTADFLAIGLDPEQSIVFLQSLVPEHLELTWIFNSITPVSELTRMTQYKDKASRQAKNINAGLFTYPVLQAADILIYKPVAVPVGRDQTQHLELTNDIARKFNKKFGEYFDIVERVTQDRDEINPDYIMSLQNPEKKMSKSEPAGCLFIEDGPEEMWKKIKKAVTESSPDKELQSALGVTNLFTLLKSFGTEEEHLKFENQRNNGSIRYSEFKEVLAKRISDHFIDYRMKKQKLIKNPSKLKKILESGSKKARSIASKTLAEVKAKIGLKL